MHHPGTLIWKQRTSRHAFLLVRADGTYNRSEIMKAAWREMRRGPNLLDPTLPAMTKAEALRFVWNGARQDRETTLHRIAIGMQEAA